MSRIATLLLAGFLVGALFIVPNPRGVSPEDEVTPLPPAFAVCLVQEGGGRTTEITTGTFDPGPLQTTLFSGGRVVGSIGATLDAYEASVVPVVDITAVGTVVGLVELPSFRAGAAVLIRGSESLAAETCTGSVPNQIASVTGGNTLAGNQFDLHLINPFAVDAEVRLTVNSEVGSESHLRFNSVTILARSSVVLEMRGLIPNREFISVEVETRQGKVLTVARQSGSNQGAMWMALEPAADWYVPLPQGDRPYEVLVANLTGLEATFQVDVFRPTGLEAAALTGSVAANGQIVLNLGEITDALALRLVSDAPVTLALRAVTTDGLAMSTGVVAPATRWVVPGALYENPVPPEPEEEIPPSESGSLVLLNPGIDDALVRIRESGSDRVSEITVTAESVHRVTFGAGDARFVESDIPIVVLWVAGNSNAFSLGVPIADG